MDILAFLDRHRLPHSPSNYAFAHRYLEASDYAFRDAVSAVIDDGVRLIPTHIERLMPVQEHGSGVESEALDRSASDVIGIIDSAAAETRDFTKSLTLAAVNLVSSGNSKIHDVVASTIAHAERAETRLRVMGRRTAQVRERLRSPFHRLRA